MFMQLVMGESKANEKRCLYLFRRGRPGGNQIRQVKGRVKEREKKGEREGERERERGRKKGES